jgi:hypothetical protein
MADLFPAEPVRAPRNMLVAEYDYCDENGAFVAQKVRFAPKGFRWRRPDPHDPTKWVSGLDGAVLGLYRSHDIAGERRVVLVEGEKAVECLTNLGLPTTCPPSGATRWDPAWSLALWESGCRELAILPDADKAGWEHAERVAKNVYELAVPEEARMHVRVVRLPGLAGHADAFDWFAEGHPVHEFLNVVAAAPLWAPGAAERARVARRRALNCERQRRFRQRQRERRHTREA